MKLYVGERQILVACVLSLITTIEVGADARSEKENMPSWQQGAGFFPILCWDPQHGWKNEYETRRNGLESMRECELTVGGFVHVKDIPLCEKLGLKAFVYGDSDGVTLSQWNGLWRNRSLSDTEINDRIRRMISRCGNSNTIIGYYVCDEPGASMFPRLAKAVECIKKYAPGKLAYINLYPNYATLGARDTSQLQTDSYAEYLERFITEVRPQLVSYDNYQVQYSGDLKDRARAASYYRNLVQVRDAALKHGLPFWNIVSSNQIRPFTTIPSPANLMFQAYTTLAAGGRGVTWYTYYTGGYAYAPIDKQGAKTLTWYYLREVNRQLKFLGPIMKELTSTGVYFTSPPPVESLPVLPGKMTREVEAEGPLMVGEFTGKEGDDFVMVVNLSLERSVKFRFLPAHPGVSMHRVSPVDGEASPMGEDHWLVAGQGILLRLSGDSGKRGK